MRLKTRHNTFVVTLDGLFAVTAYNLRYYSLALWGVHQELNPDYPLRYDCFYPLVCDSVFEWRAYGAVVLWGALLASVLPEQALWGLIAFWAILGYRRTWHYRSDFAYWEQAYKETPRANRSRKRRVETICLELERLAKAGQSFNDPEFLMLSMEARRIQDEICAPYQKG